MQGILRDDGASRRYARAVKRWKIEPLGDSAMILRLQDARITPAEALPHLRAAQRQLQAAEISGLKEVTTAYSTIAAFYDPSEVHDVDRRVSLYESMKQQVAHLLARAPRGTARATLESREIEIPVCYAPEFAIDLADVARHAKLTTDEVIRRHCAAEYVVQCVGFTPGFPYLGGLPPELATPRRPTPRTQVPAGSVAIGGSQAGIYPLTSPGGWNVIGCTPWKLFAVERAEPALLQTGDRVRFYPISSERFHAGDFALQSAANK